jgi:hypothetical protein
MRVRALFLAFLVLGSAACRSDSDRVADHQSEWRDVLSRKKAAVAPEAPAEVKQAYADSLAAFVRKHPRHSRAREVYQQVQLEFARDLSLVGRHREAARVYRAILRADPGNVDAQTGLAAAVELLAVSRNRLLSLEKGMTEREVARVLGKPLPGWTARNTQRRPPIESWFYPAAGGGVAAVHFRDGRLFAAEENSHEKLALRSESDPAAAR